MVSESEYYDPKSLSEFVSNILKGVQISKTYRMQTRLRNLVLRYGETQEASRNLLVLIWDGSEVCRVILVKIS